MRLLGIASCLLHSCPLGYGKTFQNMQLCYANRFANGYANGPLKVENRTAQAEGKRRHASDRDDCVGTRRPVLRVISAWSHKCVLRCLSKDSERDSRVVNVRLSRSGRLPNSWIFEERG